MPEDLRFSSETVTESNELVPAPADGHCSGQSSMRKMAAPMSTDRLVNTGSLKQLGLWLHDKQSSLRDGPSSDEFFGQEKALFFPE